jgi:GDSL-like Lipase/Acylhydrolase family
MPSTVKGVASRIGLILLGLLLSLAAVEGLLQVGALIVRWTVREEASTRLGSDPRVLFLGDSNTYGLYVEKAQAYPFVFEAEWNARKDVPPVQVINLAFPGTNSSQVRHLVRPVLREIEPTAVVVMVGANDFWTLPSSSSAVEHSAEGAEEETLSHELWRRVRIFRLLVMLRQALSAKRLEIDWKSSGPLPSRPGAEIPDAARASSRVGDLAIELGWKKVPEEDRQSRPSFEGPLRRNLIEIVGEILRSGAEPILATYPWDLGVYAPVNRVIRETAEATRCRCVDFALVFRQLCPRKECSFFFADGHPTVAGHAQVGRILARKLRDHG